MNVVERLKADIGDPKKKKEITEKAFKELGYDFTKNNIEVDSEPPAPKEKFFLREVIEVDRPKRVLDFCYFYSVSRKTGIVINQPFYRYADMFTP